MRVCHKCMSGWPLHVSGGCGSIGIVFSVSVSISMCRSWSLRVCSVVGVMVMPSVMTTPVMCNAAVDLWRTMVTGSLEFSR